ncbi:hypothetical protein [Francisella adeliensis]|uniref:Lipoprotein n=1 Tax=Francisella adeliensis TaxID=2007306 RepID=A0A2Z4Y0Z0_9GAMM|nr:hypothetical protein [Francisella adeliensis]AXA34576.1 hypothetical protein CDH04_09290 [Francisella adeliensis]MBK2086300.1 hypothetical protein [Francisella adeliensis]MBK2096516.1 hypothetical protein [Francisella adeliensis]QIW12821.1 hypothetical protein FZC43_09305 [Francisella adeliensis]QIW14698.1 hypothetical protein FZC44_09295 [Francisella adeliensis]
MNKKWIVITLIIFLLSSCSTNRSQVEVNLPGMVNDSGAFILVIKENMMPNEFQNMTPEELQKRMVADPNSYMRYTLFPSRNFSIEDLDTENISSLSFFFLVRSAGSSTMQWKFYFSKPFLKKYKFLIYKEKITVDREEG